MLSPVDKDSGRNRCITIGDNGNPVEVTYDQALARHRGTSWFGVAVAFRAMQLAGLILSSKDGLWDRKRLYIVSAHPGPGVKDAIEYVTHCISNHCFHVSDDVAGQTSCGSAMQFVWWINNGRHTAQITLRQDFVPRQFLQRLDRLGTPDEKESDRQLFDEEKQQLAALIWQSSLDDNYQYALNDDPRPAGALMNLEAGTANHA